MEYRWFNYAFNGKRSTRFYNHICNRTSKEGYKIPEFIRELKEFASIKLGLEDLGRQA